MNPFQKILLTRPPERNSEGTRFDVWMRTDDGVKFLGTGEVVPLALPFTARCSFCGHLPCECVEQGDCPKCGANLINQGACENCREDASPR